MSSRSKWDKIRRKEEARKSEIRIRNMIYIGTAAKTKTPLVNASNRNTFSLAQALSRALSRVRKMLPKVP